MKVRPIILMDYKALQSLLGLAKEFLYVTNVLRWVEWNFASKTYSLVDDSSTPCPKGSVRFQTKTPRSANDFTRSIKSFFKDSPVDVPLVNVYLDYDVHLIKAIIGNVMLTLVAFALAKLNSTKVHKERGALNAAFSDLDNECSPFNIF
jgi:hypothetical protein